MPQNHTNWVVITNRTSENSYMKLFGLAQIKLQRGFSLNVEDILVQNKLMIQTQVIPSWGPSKGDKLLTQQQVHILDTLQLQPYFPGDSGGCHQLTKAGK